MRSREAGQSKTTYAADKAVFPMMQDRFGLAVILLIAQLLITTVPAALAGAGSGVWTPGGPDVDLATVTHDGLGEAYGEAGQLSQVLQNIVSKGMKFTVAGETPKVHISTRPVPTRRSSSAGCPSSKRASVVLLGPGVTARYP